MELTELLMLPSCPHCGSSNPTLTMMTQIVRTTSIEGYTYRWGTYSCKRCALPVTAVANDANYVLQTFPETEIVSEDVPERPRVYLTQALISIAAPSGCIMLCASSVDAMLKEKGFTKGKLYARIASAIESHLLTPEMGSWAHQIRLDANDERHADETADLPTVIDAKNAIKFTQALAEYLYVLPAKITAGINAGTT